MTRHIKARIGFPLGAGLALRLGGDGKPSPYGGMIEILIPGGLHPAIEESQRVKGTNGMRVEEKSN
jgi:hypothetical protein